MSGKVSNTSIIKNVTIYSTYLIVIWAFYRFLFQFPEQVEELVIKPVLWLVPLFYYTFQKEHLGPSSLGFTFKNLFPAIYISIGLGALFLLEAILANYFKYGSFNFAANIGNLPLFSSLGLSFGTAISEETAFRGYIFNRLWFVTKSQWVSNLISSALWTVVHVPIAFFVWKLDGVSAIIYLALTAAFGIGSAYIFSRTKNIFGSILLHVLWEWPIILFR